MVAEGVERQHAEDWLAARKAKSLPLTRTAWSDTKAEAQKAGKSIAEAIRIAAGHGWAGYRASWSEGDAPRAVNGSHQARKSDALMAGNIAAAQRFLDGDTHHGH